MNGKKHAYLLMAHNNFAHITKLLQSLDHPRHDIYIHIDSKVKNTDYERLFKEAVKNARLIFTERHNITWGGVSQIQCELLLMETAIANGDYGYFHLISGADYPIISAEEILSFFDSHQGTEFIEIKPEPNANRFHRRYAYRNFFVKQHKHKNRLVRSFAYRTNNLLVNLQVLFKMKRKDSFEIKFGGNWFSITEKAVQLVLASKAQILKRYKHTMCCDEIFVQTAIYNSALRENIAPCELGNMRYVVWDPKISLDSPKTLDERDYDNIINSKKIFARKFDEEKSAKLVEMINKR